MLYISLKEGDYIKIGDEITVFYDHLKGKDHLVLGIKAPKDVQILRGKLYEEEIERLAAAGDENAKALSAKLKKDYQKRQKQRHKNAAKPGEHSSPPQK